MTVPAFLMSLSLANFCVGPRAAYGAQTPVTTVDFVLQANLIVIGVTIDGVALGRLVPAVEASLAAQVEEFAKLAAAETGVGGHDAYVIEYRGKKDGTEQRFRHFVVKVAERLYSFNCRADAAEFPTVEAEFGSILDSVAFLPANRDP